MLPLIATAALAIAPWHGKNLPTATPSARRYRLVVNGVPGRTVHLRVTGVAPGWIAAFCDERLCSPFRVAQTLPRAGSVVLQFELIREAGAPKTTSAVIHDNAGHSVTLRALSP